MCWLFLLLCRRFLFWGGPNSYFCFFFSCLRDRPTRLTMHCSQPLWAHGLQRQSSSRNLIGLTHVPGPVCSFHTSYLLRHRGHGKLWWLSIYAHFSCLNACVSPLLYLKVPLPAMESLCPCAKQLDFMARASVDEGWESLDTLIPASPPYWDNPKVCSTWSIAAPLPWQNCVPLADSSYWFINNPFAFSRLRPSLTFCGILSLETPCTHTSWCVLLENQN